MPDTRTPQQIVDSLRIASPCEVPWASMAGDDRARHCAQCDCKVYNIARMEAQEVVDLIRGSERMPCLQLWRRADGTVITADCPVGVRRIRSRRRISLAATALSGLLAACVGPSARVATRPTGLVVTRSTGLIGEVAKPCASSANLPAPTVRRTRGKLAVRPHPAPPSNVTAGVPMPQPESR